MLYTPISHLAVLVIRSTTGFAVLVFKSPLFYFIMAPKMLSVGICQGDTIKCFLDVKRYVCIGKNIVYMVFSTIMVSGICWGSGRYPTQIRGHSCTLSSFSYGWGICSEIYFTLDVRHLHKIMTKC